MKVDEYKSLGHQFRINVPSSVEENDKLAKREGATLKAAVDHEVFHGTLGDIREAFCELIEEASGIKRMEVTTDNADGSEGKTTKESPATFYNRVCAEKDLNPTSEPFAEQAKRLSVGGDKEVPYDPSATERKAGKPPKLPNEYRIFAAQLIESKQIPLFAKRYAKVCGKELSYDTALEGDALVVAIGWLMREMKLTESKTVGLSAFVGK